MKRSRCFDLGAIALAVTVVVGMAGVTRSEGVAPVARPSDVRNLQGPDASRPLALFIGDSYTAGKSTEEMSYGCRAAVHLGWLCALAATGGTGYISGGVANRWVDRYQGRSTSFGERISHLAVKYHPAIVILDGGRNDVFAPREDVHTTMLATLSEARRDWPSARIIVIRPRLLSHPGDDLGYDDPFMADLASQPAALGVTFIDPLIALSGTDTSTLLGPDGIHPNRLGDDRMSAALLDSLRAVFAAEGSPT